MTLLPIVGRELQVAARRRFTYWTRSGAALLATGAAVWVFETSAIVAGPAQGGRLFGLLSTLTWAACLLAGVFLTADCLSAEKRSGTLGLLFLTDLRAWDIVLGKLAASSLNGFYALLSVFPVLAMPLILGGVTWWEFARVSLGLMVTLLFSLAVGLFFSARHWQERPSMAWTTIVLILCALPTVLVPGLRLASPLGVHLLAFDTQYAAAWPQYEIGLGTVFGLACLFLWGASQVLSWQDEPEPRPARWNAFFLPGRAKSRATGAPMSAARRAAALEADPAAWLFSRQCKGNLVWLVTFLGACFLLLFWFTLSSQWFAILVLICAIHAALKLCMAWEASRLLEDHYRAGGLELVLVSRMSVVELLRGCTTTLRQVFKRAVMVILVLDLISAGIVVAASLAPGGAWGSRDVLTGTMMTGLVLLGMLFLELWALSWLGMWLGLYHHQTWRGALGCALRVFVLPWVLPIAALVLSGGAPPGLTGPPVALLLAWILGSFVVAYGLGVGAKRKLHEQLRERVSATMLPDS